MINEPRRYLGSFRVECGWLEMVGGYKSAICSNQLMVTRTGIEKIPSLSAAFSKMRKWLYFGDF